MSTNSNLHPLVPLLVAIAVSVLFGQPAHAHEELRKKPASTPVAGPSVSLPSHAREHPGIAIAGDGEHLPVLIGVTGFLGGSLLYGIDHLAWYSQ